jgi:hypothetical protein
MIYFIQYLRPDGRREPASIERPPEIEALANAVRIAGGRFEIEVLRTGAVSMEVVADNPEDPDEPLSVAHELCGNGPEVPPAVDRLVRQAYETLVASKGTGN